MVEAALPAAPARSRGRAAMVIAGASVGTLFEWYDFFLYGSLASLIAKHFFAGVDERAAFAFALTAFAAGYIARPFGAVVFGRVGDVVGRKNTFLVTMTIMGVSTFLVGLLPDYATIGVAAPVVLVLLRLLQGLAIGGEYGGAAIYVAEHAPPDRRGRDASWINAVATGGLITSLLVVIACRVVLSDKVFGEWGWRIPFLLSFFLLAISVWIRLSLAESPIFQRMKDENTLSQAPLSETFLRWGNLRLILLALFGCVTGSTVVWYTAQFYQLFFLQRVLKVDDLTVNVLMAVGLTVALPSFYLLGWLSDRIGRKPVMMAGCAAGALLLFPLFHGLTQAANPALAHALATAPVTVRADPATCGLQFDPVGGQVFDASACDIAKAYLTKAGVGYRTEALPAGSSASVEVAGHTIIAAEPAGHDKAARTAAAKRFAGIMAPVLAGAGYPAKADPAAVNAPLVVAIVALLVTMVAMTYAPMAAFLVELFPARIRYTSMSFPYHLGSGWVGGLLPVTAFAIVSATGDLYAGLWYPVGFCAVATVLGTLFLPETKGRPID